jgi:hypothetical protein
MIREIIRAVFVATRTRLTGGALQATGESAKALPSFGRAMIANQPQTPAGGPQIAPLDVLIHRRAIRAANRKAETVEAFVRVHTILRKAR